MTIDIPLCIQDKVLSSVHTDSHGLVADPLGNTMAGEGGGGGGGGGGNG